MLELNCFLLSSLGMYLCNLRLVLARLELGLEFLIYFAFSRKKEKKNKHNKQIINGRNFRKIKRACQDE